MRWIFLSYLFSMNCLLAVQVVHDHGYWQGENVDGLHVFDPALAEALREFFTEEKAHSVVDFGCGQGLYVGEIRGKEGLIACEGYDGNPATPKISRGLGQVLDLAQSFDLHKRFDWVLSLEVGEHIPAQFEKTFIENLTRHAVNGIVLSWAVPGQGGFGHFNEQTNQYIKDVMAQHGYYNDLYAEGYLRERASVAWFKNTVMVFRKQGK